MSDLLLYLPSNIWGLTILACIFIFGLFFLFQTHKTAYLLYALIIWLPLESLVLLYSPIEYYAYIKYFPEVLLYGFVFFSWFYFIKHKQELLPYNPLNYWFVAYIVVAAISLILNFYSPFTWALGLRQVLRFALVFFAVLLMSYKKETQKKFLYLIGFMIFIEAFLGLAQYLSGGALDRYLFSTRVVNVGNSAYVGGLEQFWSPGTRIFATMGRYDQLGSILALGIIMLFPLRYLIQKQQQKIWYYFIFFFLIFILIFTFSRASWLAAFFGVFTIGVFLKKDQKIMKIFGAFILLLGFYLVFYLALNQNAIKVTEKPTQTLTERIVEAFSFHAWRESYEGYGRIFFIINTPLKVVASAPIFGHGPGRYGGGVAAALFNTEVYDKLHLPFGIQNVYGQIDNSWFSIWGETGTFGLLVWIMIFASLINVALIVGKEKNHDYENALAVGFVGLTVGIMIMGFFGPYFEFRTLMFYYWLIAGIVMLLWRKRLKKWNFRS